MPACNTCGNVYDKAFQLVHEGEAYWFDSFECAITLLAPSCAQCRCRVIGHGVEADGNVYCCAHCAKAAGEPRLRDRV